MFRVVSGYCDAACGTSRIGEIEIAPALLVQAFGKPGESDGYKVSGEWVFIDDESGVVITVYDWKSTSLYDDESAPSPEQFWATTTPMIINIGGNEKARSIVEEFKRRVVEHIQMNATGKLPPAKQKLLA